MRHILILFAHPAFEQSRMNRHMRAAALDVPGVTFHDLYEEYPDFDVDVQREQRLLAEHDVVVLQHPFYWYSVPALLKQYFDLVLEYGWAYGETGRALHGKTLVVATTTGGGKATYTPEGIHETTMDELLAPLRQTARLCGMQFASPFVAYGTLRMRNRDMTEEARRYQARLLELSSGERVTEPPCRPCTAGELSGEMLRPVVVTPEPVD